MRNLMPGLTLISSLFLPIEANAAQSRNADSRTGAFVGARLQMPLGGRSAAMPRASLSIAPTFVRTSSSGEMRTSLGEGVALNLGSQPTLTLAGARADRALGFGTSQELDSKQKLGLSKGAWITVGAVVVAAAVYGYVVYDTARDNSD
jgi:hypothetical protein